MAKQKDFTVKVGKGWVKRTKKQLGAKRRKAARTKTIKVPAKRGCLGILLFRPTPDKVFIKHTRAGWELLSNNVVTNSKGVATHYIMVFKRDF